MLLSGVDQAGVVKTSIAIQTAKYGKNVTGDYHDDDSSEDSDEEDACSSEDEVLAAGPWSEEEEFIINYTRNSHYAVWSSDRQCFNCCSPLGRLFFVSIG